MTIRYIADMHLDDEDIIAYDNRPFDSTEEMNEALIANWNRVVSPDDLTWILGDFCAGNTASWERHLSRLNGKKALIIGAFSSLEGKHLCTGLKNICGRTAHRLRLSFYWWEF